MFIANGIWISHFLSEKLNQSSPSRIINVSSTGHRWTRGIDFDNLKAEKNYKMFNLYSVSKLGNILFTRELARRLQGTGLVSTYNFIHSEFWIFQRLLTRASPISRDPQNSRIIWCLGDRTVSGIIITKLIVGRSQINSEVTTQHVWNITDTK